MRLTITRPVNGWSARVSQRASAVRRVRPAWVDVSGGVEAEPGRKDARAIAAFVRNARAAAAAQETA